MFLIWLWPPQGQLLCKDLSVSTATPTLYQHWYQRLHPKGNNSKQSTAFTNNKKWIFQGFWISWEFSFIHSIRTPTFQIQFLTLSVAKGSGLQYLTILPPLLPAQHPDRWHKQESVHQIYSVKSQNEVISKNIYSSKYITHLSNLIRKRFFLIYRFWFWFLDLCLKFVSSLTQLFLL